MNGNAYGKKGYIIIDRDDVNCILDSISELAGHFISYPDDADGAPAATAAFHKIRDSANGLRDAVYEMIGDTRLRIKKPDMAIEEATI